MTAEDFVYAWQRLADPDSHSPYAALLSVVCGYQEARLAKDMSLLQVSAPSDTMFEVTLTGNYDWFLREVCTSPATLPLRQDVVQRLKEAGSADGEAASWWQVKEKKYLKKINTIGMVVMLPIIHFLTAQVFI